MTESAAWSVVWRSILLVATLVLLSLLIYQLRSVIIQFLLAVLLAAAATPMVNALTRSERALGQRWRPSRGLAAPVLFLGAVVLLALGVLTIVATVTPDINELAASLPGYAGRLQSAVDELVARDPVPAEPVEWGAALIAGPLLAGPSVSQVKLHVCSALRPVCWWCAVLVVQLDPGALSHHRRRADPSLPDSVPAV